jgi:hypothetical protein
VISRILYLILVVNLMLFAFLGEYAKSVRRNLIMCKINESLAYLRYFRFLHPRFDGMVKHHLAALSL